VFVRRSVPIISIFSNSVSQSPDMTIRSREGQRFTESTTDSEQTFHSKIADTRPMSFLPEVTTPALRLVLDIKKIVTKKKKAMIVSQVGRLWFLNPESCFELQLVV
jgi:hypothetical protein